jgi:Cu/Ag efflux protein CusF
MYKLLAAVLLLTVGSAATAAQGAANPPVSPTAPGSNAASAELADGEVRRVDRETRKITLRHGEIKSLDMPPMTMVFRVSDDALLEKLKPGDRVRFNAQLVDGNYTVTRIEALP